jgi:hypothetical protein
MFTARDFSSECTEANAEGARKSKERTCAALSRRRRKNVCGSFFRGVIGVCGAMRSHNRKEELARCKSTANAVSAHVEQSTLSRTPT